MSARVLTPTRPTSCRETKRFAHIHRARKQNRVTRIGTSDLDVFPFNLGGNVFGWTADKTESVEVLDAFRAAGGNFIDTADSYSAWVPGNTGGESEVIIGEWLYSRKNRADVVVATKVGQHPEFMGLAYQTVIDAADASLTRLGTDHIDLYYAHYDDETTPLEETARAFSDLVHAGKVRYIGLSNYSADRVDRWFDIAEKNDFVLPVALQPHYNLVHREPFERELAPVVERHGLGVLPYSSLASGFLTGKYRTSADLEGARATAAGRYVTEEGLGVLNALSEIASARGVAVATIALAWLRAKSGVVAPIASARTIDQLPDLIAAATLDLAADEIAALDTASSSVPEGV
jgi:aryl-alcohol dehydrogenase-like predicted oxidoreductase